MKIIDIKLTYNCNNHCHLCCQEDTIKNADSNICESIIFDYINKFSLKDMENIKVVLTGGEPTLHPNIIQIIKQIRRAGIKVIQLQSNITLKSRNLSIEELIDAGITSFGVSLHGCTAEMHEKFTQTTGSFNDTIRNLLNISRLDVPVALNCVISNYNVKHLSEIVDFIAKNNLASNIQFAFIHITGRASFHQSLVPPISLAAHSVRSAIATADNYGIIVKSEAIPFCLMPKFEKNIAEIDKLDDITVLDKKGILNFSKCRLSSLKAKRIECRQCLFFSMCEGPWREYPELFGWNEFIPVRSVVNND